MPNHKAYSRPRTPRHGHARRYTAQREETQLLRAYHALRASAPDVWDEVTDDWRPLAARYGRFLADLKHPTLASED